MEFLFAEDVPWSLTYSSRMTASSFCKASGQRCHALNKILELYEEASGQKINIDKSYVFFSHNTLDDTKKEVLDILGPM